MRFIFAIIIFSLFSQNVSGQAKTSKVSRKYIEFYYYNMNSVNACYFDPYFSMDLRKGRTFKIRYDRMDEKSDTIILYFNDTTILKHFESNNQTDEFLKRVNPNRTHRLAQNQVKTIRVYFRKPRYYAYIKIYYSFSSNCTELKTEESIWHLTDSNSR